MAKTGVLLCSLLLGGIAAMAQQSASHSIDDHLLIAGDQPERGEIVASTSYRTAPGSSGGHTWQATHGSAASSRAPTSAHFIMDRLQFSASAGRSSSTRFKTTVSLGASEPTGSASACNASYQGSFGFWSILGNLPVPIALRLDKVSGDAALVDLEWSGAAPLFRIYRASSPDELVHPLNLATETTSCSFVDDQPTTRLTFYTVTAGGSQ